jgi:hypothetical protein
MGWRFLQYKRAYDVLMADCTDAMKAALRPRMAQLLALGNMATPPVTKALGKGLFELRAVAGRVRIRLLFGYLPGQRIVFVWGGTKDQRTLPPRTIQAARRLLDEATNAEAANVTDLN